MKSGYGLTLADELFARALGHAQSLLEKADKGEPIRIGFANEIPFAYPGDDGSPKGFVNVFKGTGRVYLSPMPNYANMLRNVVSSSMYAYSSSSS